MIHMSLMRYLAGLGATIAVISSLVLFGLSAWNLYRFMDSTNRSVENVLAQPADDQVTAKSLSESVLLTRFAMARIAFNACGLAIGLAMAFLAAALFLVGVSDSMYVEGMHRDSQLNISGMSAGGFAILCSTAIIMTCVIVKPSLKFEGDGGGGAPWKVQAPEPPPPPETGPEDGPLSRATIEAYELPGTRRATE